MREPEPRPRDPVQQRRGGIGVALHADRETKQQQRLDIVAIVLDETAANALALPVPAAFQQRQSGIETAQTLRRFHSAPRLNNGGAVSVVAD